MRQKTQDSNPDGGSGLWIYESLLRIRPAQLGALVKSAVRLKRRSVFVQTGHRFWIDPVSVFGLQLLRTGAYEPQMTSLLGILLRPTDIFVDIGGNEGYFSVLASSLVPQGAVHCIEPQSRLIPILSRHITANFADRVLVHHLAISDCEAEVPLFLRPSTNTGASSMFAHWRVGRAAEMVRCTTLDAFFDKNRLERVRLLKVDCEGAESFVVKGARRVLRERRIDFIAMEYHACICGSRSCDATHQTLMAAGYELSKVNGQRIYHAGRDATDLQALGEVRRGGNWSD